MRVYTTKNIYSYLIVLLGLSFLALFIEYVFEFKFMFSGIMIFIPSVATLAIIIGFRSGLQINFRISNYFTILISIISPVLIELLTSQILVFLDYYPNCSLSNYTYPPISIIPIITIVSVGEEVGVRGLLQTYLVEKFGVVMGVVVVGLIWSIWRIIFLVFPISSLENVLVNSGYMIIFSILYSISVGLFYETNKSILIPISFSIGTYYTFLLNNRFILELESTMPALLVKLGLWVLLVEISLWMFLSKEK